ncbi:9126_t:CDS:1, partial [Dentiscutata erythropus]
MPKTQSPVTKKPDTDLYNKKAKREIFTNKKIESYITKKGYQLNQELLEFALLNCFSNVEEHLKIVDVLKKIQYDQLTQITLIKEKIPKSRQHVKFEEVNNWLDKVYKGVNTGVTMSL